MLTRFEEQYENHTARLAWLMARRRDRRSAVYNLAEISNCRNALAETARVLRCMADRDFGRCAHCSGDIPVDWLVARPEDRCCPDCEQALSA